METKPCRHCNGVGLTRNDDPNSDRVYGEYCTSCNGTGINGSIRLGCFLIGALAVVTFAPLIWWLW